MKVSSIPAQHVIIKLRNRVVLKDTKNLFMKVSSISAQCAIIKLKNRGVLQSTKNQFTKVSDRCNLLNSTYQGVRESAGVPQLVMLCRWWAHLQCFAGRTGCTHGTTADYCVAGKRAQYRNIRPFQKSLRSQILVLSPYSLCALSYQIQGPPTVSWLFSS